MLPSTNTSKIQKKTNKYGGERASIINITKEATTLCAIEDQSSLFPRCSLTLVLLLHAIQPGPYPPPSPLLFSLVFSVGGLLDPSIISSFSLEY